VDKKNIRKKKNTFFVVKVAINLIYKLQQNKFQVWSSSVRAVLTLLSEKTFCRFFSGLSFAFPGNLYNYCKKKLGNALKNLHCKEKYQF